MKKSILLFIFIVFTSHAYAQTNGKNYIRETIYRTSMSSGGIESINSSNNFVNITYLDEFGRPEQIIHQNASPIEEKNIVEHIEYERYIGQTKKYLPFTTTGKTQVNIGGINRNTYSGNFNENGKSKTIDHYNSLEYDFTSNPFAEIKLKGNLKNDVKEIASPGNDWAINGGHTIKLDELSNVSQEVKLFKADATWNYEDNVYKNTLNTIGYFQPNSLKKEIIKNENWKNGKNNTTEVFKDDYGKIYLIRRYNNSIVHDTYYVYNQRNQLSFIITPEASALTITEDLLNNLCFQYNYDANGNIAQKKVPGKKWEYFVYDKAGRLAMSGPNLNPFGTGTEGWLFIKYDYLSRPIMTGFYYGHEVNSTNQKILSNNLKGSQVTYFYEVRQSNAIMLDGIAVNYTNQTFPISNFYLLDMKYYDSYGFVNGPNTLENVNGITPNNNVKGFMTGEWVRNITVPSEKKGDLTYIAYNEKYRPIRINTNHASEGFTQQNSKYNFFGNPIEIETVHKKGTSDDPITMTEKLTYNSREYLLKHTQTINGREELLASYEYNDLGKLIRKNVGNNENKPLQKIDYKYNIRGWLKQINNPNNLNENNDNDLFGLQINYNTTEDIPSPTNKQYNGNINSVVWKTRTDNIRRGYTYEYDELNRLIKGNYFKNNSQTEDFFEEVYYNKNGNITSLLRSGENINGQFNEIDDVVYNYVTNSNKLLSIHDYSNNSEGINDFNKNGNDFEYDSFGNLVVDKNRNISKISYNHFNQPIDITFSTNDKITFEYDSQGNRIKKSVLQNGITKETKYINGFEYTNNQLKYIATKEGFIKFENNQFNYVYQYKDQIGNVRLTYSDLNKDGEINPVSEILQENNYYPFGLKHSYNQMANNFENSLLPNAGFNGQPHLLDLDVNLSLMDFRLYDPALGRFFGIDLLADSFMNHSPYHFSYNNPASFSDPTGLSSDPPEETLDELIIPKKNNPNPITRPGYYGNLFPLYQNFYAINPLWVRNGGGGGGNSSDDSTWLEDLVIVKERKRNIYSFEQEKDLMELMLVLGNMLGPQTAKNIKGFDLSNVNTFEDFEKNYNDYKNKEIHRDRYIFRNVKIVTNIAMGRAGSLVNPVMGYMLPRYSDDLFDFVEYSMDIMINGANNLRNQMIFQISNGRR